MKTKILSVAMVVYLVVLVGCQSVTPESSSTPPDTSASSVISSQSSVDAKHDFTEYEYKYFNPVADATIIAKSWDSVSEIPADYLVQFFGNDTQLSRLSNDAEPIVVPSNIVESYIQLFFAVDNNHIRQSNYYDSNNDTYLVPIVSGGAALAKVVAVTEKDDCISLFYEYYSPSDDITVIRKGTLLLSSLSKLQKLSDDFENAVLNDKLYAHLLRYICSKQR